MRQKIIYLILFIIFIPLNTKAINLELYSKQAILYDTESMEILYEKDSNVQAPIASLTKIMTTIVALENIDDVDSKVVITYDMLKDIPNDASVAGLRVGDKVTYLDLLYASILPSGADATTTLAINLGGSIDNFVSLMNTKASELGMLNTHYSDVTGYSSINNYSTPDDVLKLLIYSLNNELFKKIYTTNSYKLSNGLEVQSTINKYNKILKYDTSNIIGSKTGYTNEAGLCISALTKTNDRELILITMGADYKNKKPYNLIDTLNVIDYMNENFYIATLYKKDSVLFSIPVSTSNIEEYDVLVSEDIKKYIEKDYNIDDISYKYNGIDELSYKNKKGEKIGQIKYYYKDKEFYKEDVYLNKKLKFSFLKYFLSHIYIFIIIFVILIIIFLVKLYKKRLAKSKLS